MGLAGRAVGLADGSPALALPQKISLSMDVSGAHLAGRERAAKKSGVLAHCRGEDPNLNETSLKESP